MRLLLESWCFLDSFKNLCSSSNVKLQSCLVAGDKSLNIQIEWFGLASFDGNVNEAIERTSKRSGRRSSGWSL